MAAAVTVQNPAHAAGHVQRAQPSRAAAPAVAAPKALAKDISPEMWGLLTSMQTITIRQHTKLLPQSPCACPPCVPQANTYSIYAGATKDAEAEILRVDEVSDDWNRCCCKPYHPLRLEARQYIPVPGDGSGSDYSHLSADTQQSLKAFAGGRRARELRELYLQQPAVLSMVRDDGMRCCGKLPCKWLSACVFCAPCQDGMSVYAGPAPDAAGAEAGRPPHELDLRKLLGTVVQPLGGGGLTPTLLLTGGEKDGRAVFGKVEGPCCFGGWAEMCCDFHFFASMPDSPPKTGDLAMISKKKPGSLPAAFAELVSDADVYVIRFNEHAQLTAPQKATLLAAQLLVDYMFFDGNTDKCAQRGGTLQCFCCYLACCGAVCPVRLCIPSGSGST